MATNFPSSADSFTNPTSGDTLDNPPHDQQHSDINDAMEAVQGALLDGAPLHVDTTNDRVGIGNNSPNYPLHVSGAVTLSASGQTDSGNSHFPFSDGRFYYTADPETGGAGDHVFRHFSDGSYVEQMRILENGNVGIGTDSPQTPLHISQTGADALRIQKSNNDQQGSYISMWDDDSRLGYIGYAGNDDLYLENEASAGKTFLSTGGATRLTVDSSGNVGIGTTSPGSMLDVRGGVQTHRILPFSDNTYDLGANVLRWDDVYATNGTIQTSDERDKSSITDIDLGLAFVNGLRPVTYTWDDRSGNVGARTHMGFVAQEVATALGDEASNRAVWIHASAEQTTDPETGEVDEGRDIQGLRYNELLAPLVKAVQELSATVGTLTARIEALEAG